MKEPGQQSRVLDPSGSLYHHWSMVVSLAFLYNFWSLSYRFAFQEINYDTVAPWFALDYSADLIYLLDVVINFRTGYLEDGVLQRKLDKIGQHYRECTLFYLDCFCLLPLDILYLSIGFNSILRCTRLVKIYKFWAYVDRTERHTNYPNVFRTFTLVHYILVIFHWNACLFHMISKNRLIDIENLYRISDNRCEDILCQYLYAFYWSTLALTTIGDLPRPRTKGEYLYVTCELFFGLFVFASVLGHVANIVTNVSAARKEFQAKLDAVKTFMRTRRVSDELQNKVIRWFDYLWISQKSSDEDRSVACLPDRLKAEIAIHVHLDTLKRVDIFQNTEAGFLCELVLRLKPVLFSPGDYVCRKNEVGHEMYIVSRGTLEVVAEVDEPPDGAKPNRKTTLVVVATLKAGSYFGEISVLNVGLAGNKRTASVRSVGYSDLFCLKRQDLWDVLKNYPAAEQRIRARAEERLSKLDMNPANATSSCETPQAPAIDLMSSRASQPRDGACGAHRRRVCSSSSSTRCQLAACSTRVRHRHERRALPPSCPHSYLAATASRRHLYLAAAEPLPVPAGYWPCASMNQLTCQLDHGCSRITAGPDEQLTTSCRRPSRRQRRQAAAARRCLERDQGEGTGVSSANNSLEPEESWTPPGGIVRASRTQDSDGGRRMNRTTSVDGRLRLSGCDLAKQTGARGSAGEQVAHLWTGQATRSCRQVATDEQSATNQYGATADTYERQNEPGRSSS